MTISAQQSGRVLCGLSVILYVAGFALPDRWIHWSGPPPRHSVKEYYFIPEMLSRSRGWESLDWAGWLGHVALIGGFLLFAVGRSRCAVGAAVLALVFGLARFATSFTMGFLAGYYLWLGSMIVLGIAAIIRARSQHIQSAN